VATRYSEGQTPNARIHLAEVTFVTAGKTPERATVQARVGQSVLHAAQTAGLDIVATCGGRGQCRSCRVKILEGDVPPPTVQDRIQLGHEGVREQFRLSCQTKLIRNCTVLVAPPKSEAGHQILGAGSRTRAEAKTKPDSGVEKRVIVAKVPATSSGEVSDVDAILAMLGDQCNAELPLEVLRKIPAALRAREGLVTVTTFNGEVIDIEAGDTCAQSYGIAFDIGTTTIVGTLLDLATGEQLAAVSDLNPQAVYGGDVMSRIEFSQFDEKKLSTLRARVLNAVNELVFEACRQANVRGERIYKAVFVGNTCMHHLFLGIDASSLGMAPYTPVVRAPIVLRAKELPLKAAPNARICLLPIIAGFVGADTVAAALATRIHESDQIRLLVDIGTNSEAIMGSKERLVACSAPAGPAFEGGQVKHGMRAALGAIEGVEIEEDAACRVIGDVPAIGICGSGLIDATAKMLDAGLLDAGGALLERPKQGRLSPRLAARLRETEQGGEFVLVKADQAGKGEDITITQKDVRQLQLAKAAIYSGILILQQVMGVSDDQIAEIMLSGGFGNYINIGSALRIRLLPPLPADRISYVGNAAHTGAELALLSETARHEAHAISQRIEHVGLAEHPEFERVFVDALSLASPVHTIARNGDGAAAAASVPAA